MVPNELFNYDLARLYLTIINLYLSLYFKLIRLENASKQQMKLNITSKNNQGINTMTKALINSKCQQIYSNNHTFLAPIKTPN